MSPVLVYILEHTFTIDDLHRRLRLLQECLEEVLYHEPQQIRVVPPEERWRRALSARASETDLSVLSALDVSLRNEFAPATLVQKMKVLQEEAQTIPVMVLYTPVRFTDKQLAPMSSWARSEVANFLLFDVTVDPDVVGGCAFVYKGTHFDWSLRRYLRAKKGMITTLMNTYEH